jgi:hypothetical protein
VLIMMAIVSGLWAAVTDPGAESMKFPKVEA